MTTIAELQAAVAATTDVQASALRLIQGLVVQLQAVAAKLAAQGADPAALDALTQTLNTHAAAFAAAVAANTPAESADAAPPTP